VEDDPRVRKPAYVSRDAGRAPHTRVSSRTGNLPLGDLSPGFFYYSARMMNKKIAIACVVVLLFVNYRFFGEEKEKKSVLEELIDTVAYR